MKILHSFHSAHSQLLMTCFVGDVNIVYYVSVLMHIFLTSFSILNHLNEKYYYHLFVLRELNLWESINSFKSAAAAKSLQTCPTLCDPIDGSLPGSPVPGILQARTLEWVAISFSNAWKWKVKGKSLSRVWLLATPWTAAYQAPPPMGYSRQEYWSGVPLPSPLIQDYEATKYKSDLDWCGLKLCVVLYPMERNLL